MPFGAFRLGEKMNDFTQEDVNASIRHLVLVALGGLILNNWFLWVVWFFLIVAALGYGHMLGQEEKDYSDVN